MSGFSIVLLRELRERWAVVAVAAVAAVIPVLAPWLPGVTGGGDTQPKPESSRALQGS